MIEPGYYTHYKSPDKQYEVIGIATHESTREKLVTYRALYDIPELGHHPLFVRPLAEFEELVEWNGEKVRRFKII